MQHTSDKTGEVMRCFIFD